MGGGGAGGQETQGQGSAYMELEARLLSSKGSGFWLAPRNRRGKQEAGRQGRGRKGCISGCQSGCLERSRCGGSCL